MSIKCTQCGEPSILDAEGLCEACSDEQIDGAPVGLPRQLYKGRAAADKRYYESHRAQILAQHRVYSGTAQRKAARNARNRNVN